MKGAEDMKYILMMNTMKAGCDAFPTWPKNVTVVSRTDLNLEKCAAEGVLVYKKAAFLESVAKVFGIHLD